LEEFNIWGKVAEKDVPKYTERINHELEVLTGAGLSSYFLIVQDYCNWARNQGMMLNVGRGSSAGSLLIYLLVLQKLTRSRTTSSLNDFTTPDEIQQTVFLYPTLILTYQSIADQNSLNT
jgi:hypothetical protein